MTSAILWGEGAECPDKRVPRLPGRRQTTLSGEGVGFVSASVRAQPSAWSHSAPATLESVSAHLVKKSGGVVSG